MEKAVLKQVEEMSSMPHVIGSVCTDKDGLCIVSHGCVVNKTTAGLASSIAGQANRLSTGASIDSNSPVVCLETENTLVLIKTDANITTAVFKDVPQSN
jgi:predicted regulator of Ras-like GTPase activity (Roadblock/LC7/MglB family)